MEPAGRDAAASEHFEVVVRIDTIDDVYSDFDPRAIDVRIISADFINELRLQGSHAPGDASLEVRILAPRAIRRNEIPLRAEKITRLRISGYFQEEHRLLLADRRKKLARGLIFLVSGLTCFFIVKLAGNGEENHLAVKTLLELITFSSWFATWNGIDTLGNLPRKEDIRLVRKLADANISFTFVKDAAAISRI